jgi:hypothetical protein
MSEPTLFLLANYSLADVVIGFLALLPCDIWLPCEGRFHVGGVLYFILLTSFPFPFC